MTITDKLEGLLPADGNLTTKDERVIAEAVKELRFYRNRLEWDDQWRESADGISCRDDTIRLLEDAQYRWRDRAIFWKRAIPLAFATGCIASAIFVVLV